MCSRKIFLLDPAALQVAMAYLMTYVKALMYFIENNVFIWDFESGKYIKNSEFLISFNAFVYCCNTTSILKSSFLEYLCESNVAYLMLLKSCFIFLCTVLLLG